MKKKNALERKAYAMMATFSKMFSAIKIWKRSKRRQNAYDDSDFESRLKLAREIEIGALGRRVTWGELPPSGRMTKVVNKWKRKKRLKRLEERRKDLRRTNAIRFSNIASRLIQF